MATRDVATAEIADARQKGSAMVYAGMDYLHVRQLPDGRAVYLMPHSFGGLRLNIGTPGSLCFDDEWHYQGGQWREAWCAALGWDGEGDPEGWYRHPATGRRRPDGDPSKEYFHP